MRGLLSALLLSVTVLSFAAVPSDALAQKKESREQVVEVSPIRDPLEPFNRAVFGFNKYVDLIVLKPVTTVYKAVFPGFVRNSVSAFLGNLGSPVVMLNELLQGNFKGFEHTLHRFVINTTLGLGGINDVASHLGLPDNDHGDFGQTLGVWGVGHGFYLVLPIVGPSSLRDGAGFAVDSFVDPYNQVFMDSETEWPIYARAGVTVIDKRSRYGDQYDQVMRDAVDPYVTFRSIYAQRRAYLVQGKAATNGRGYDAYSAAEAK